MQSLYPAQHLLICDRILIDYHLSPMPGEGHGSRVDAPHISEGSLHPTQGFNGSASVIIEGLPCDETCSGDTL